MMKYMIIAAVVAALVGLGFTAATPRSASADAPCVGGDTGPDWFNVANWQAANGFNDCNEYNATLAAVNACIAQKQEEVGPVLAKYIPSPAFWGTLSASHANFGDLPLDYSTFCKDYDRVTFGLKPCMKWEGIVAHGINPDADPAQCAEWEVNAFHRGICIDAVGNQGVDSNPKSATYGQRIGC